MIVTQTQFRAGLLDPNIPAPTGLVNPDGAQASKRFDVYRNNVAVSLTEALEATFPVIHKLVGDAFFRAMAGVYLRQHPPTSPMLMLYGDKMPQFLRRFGPAKSLPYLSDIAWVEDLMRHAYHAADAVPIDAAALAKLTPEKLMATRFTFAPSTYALTSDYPIYSIYLANTTQDAPNPAMRAEAMLIARPKFDPQQTLITAAAAACITYLIEGKPLGVAMTTAGNDLDLGTTLGLLLGQGCITALT
tara:strand:- start:1165 stop:1902 length:738 start_codon:yes stop_codon:yes gene_type:complete